MKNFPRRHNLYKKDDIWLFGLKYMLDVPHHKIVATGEAIQDKYGGPEGVLPMLVTRVDPDIEKYCSGLYGDVECIISWDLGSRRR